MVPADKYMNDDLIFEVFKDPLGLIMFSNNFAKNNSPSTMTRSKDLTGDFNERIFSDSNVNIIDNLPDPLKLIRNLADDEDIDLIQENSDDVDRIFKTMLEKYPSIIETFKAYKIPNHIIKLFTKKIITFTLESYHKSIIDYFEER